MNTQIKLTYNGEEYILEYNRMTIKMLEASGFKYQDFLDKPMTNIELAFTAAFIKNYPNIKQTIIDDIYNNCKNKQALVGTISKMIDECYDSLLSDPTKEDGSGNVEWETVDLSPKEKSQK